MSLQGPISKALACQGCQQWMVRSFISAVGGASALQRQRRQLHLSRRPFSTTNPKRNESQRNQDEEEHPLNDINESFAGSGTPAKPKPTTEEPAQTQAQDNLPWYLQHQPPIPRYESPLSSRQQLPPLPNHSPPILQPLLEHTSADLGIDDLNLLDLRALDPPPALGANLLMVVGTARSEKHLHISADRLCRWLRSSHNVSPHADGLLGRNELKLKLKRRAKRSKLLSAVGAKATAQTEIDDGIRTGWVCVNIGRVEGGDLPGRMERAREMVGFGPEESGSSIVVQMMTEEKRSEMDLEALWEDHLVRARRKKDTGRSVEDEDAREDMLMHDTNAAPKDTSTLTTGYQHFTPASSQFVGQAVRAYHTSARRLQASPATEVSHTTDTISTALRQEQGSPAQYEPSADLLAAMITGLKAMNPAQTMSTLGPNILAASAHVNLDTALKQTPRSTSPDFQQEGARGETTPFLQRFYSLMPAYPGPEHWHQHIELLACARAAGHQEGHSYVLFAQLTNMQIAGLIPEERTFRIVIESVLSPLGTGLAYDGVKYNIPSYSKLQSILALLEDMESYGYDPVQPAILGHLYEACVGSSQGNGMSNEWKKVIAKFTLARLELLARGRFWPAFWFLWRSYPARFLPRTAEMYTILFSAIGKGYLTSLESSPVRRAGEEKAKGYSDLRPRYSNPGSSYPEEKTVLGLRETIEVMRRCLEEMEMEQPKVWVEEHWELATSVMHALEFVEPELKGARGEVEGPGREWFRWYERCLSVVTGSG